jgi:hypothetical protein
MVSHGIGDMLSAEELFNRTWNRQIAILPAGRIDRLFEIAPNPLESVARLFGQPLDDAPIVVAVAGDVVKPREAVPQTVGLHVVELLPLETVIPRRPSHAWRSTSENREPGFRLRE